MAGEFGIIFIGDFDRGVVTTLGSKLVDIEIDGDVRKSYVLECPGLIEYSDHHNLPEELRPMPVFPTGTVPVFFVHPEDAFQPWILPCIVIRRGEMTPNFARAPWYGYQVRALNSAPNVPVQIGGQWLSGPSQKVYRWNPVPYDIGYEIQTYARSRNDGNALLRCVLKVTRPPSFQVQAFDSMKCSASYRAVNISVSDLSELADVADRTIAHSVGFELWGEFDLDDDLVSGVDLPPLITSLPEVTYRPFYPPPVIRPDC